MRNTFRVLFYIKRTAPRRNGDVPVMARITINGERAQLAVRAYVDPALWDVRTGLAAGRSAAASELNEKLLLVRRRIERCYETLLARQAAVTPALVREMYFGNDRQQETLLAFFRQHNEEFGRMVGVSRSKSSYYKYRSVYRLLAASVRERCRRADIPFRELDKRFLAGFHQYIARESPHKKNTAWVYMIAFKHILMLARSRDLLSADLFAGYRLRSEFVARDYLTETEIRRLMLLAPTDRTQRLVLDAFLFSCFTGLSYIDIRQLKPANIRYTQGQLWIGTTRRKTGSDWTDRRLAAVDLKWAALDPADSIFTRLAGQTERLVTDKQLAEAVGQAPADTRAWLRAEIVRRFPEQVVAASWSHLTVRGESSGDENVENSMVSLDMSNPLKFTESLCSEAFERVHTASGIVESLR